MEASSAPGVEIVEEASGGVAENTQRNNDNTSGINREPLRSLNWEHFNSVFFLGGRDFCLNSSGTNRLVVGFASRKVPELKIVFKLHDVKNGYFIQFSKKTWDDVVQYNETINEHIKIGILDEIFDDNRIKISTIAVCNTICVTFTNRSQKKIIMFPETFNAMISLEHEINEVYAEMEKKIKEVTNSVKFFMELSFFHLYKSNNVDNVHNNRWRNLFRYQPNNFVELNNSIANLWLELGKWENQTEGQASTSSARNDL